MGRQAPRRVLGVAMGAGALLSTFLLTAPRSVASGNVPPPPQVGAPARLESMTSRGMTLQIRLGLTLRTTPRGAEVQGAHRFFSFDSFGGLWVRGKEYGIGLQGFEDRRNPPVLLVSMGRAIFLGTRWAFQIHSYEVDLPASALTISKDLTSAHIDTGDALGRWGRIDMTFHPAGDPVARCGGLNVRQRGSADGSLSFTPHADNGFFGTITRTAFRHSVVSVRAGCNGGGGGGGGVYPCPTQRFLVNGYVGRRSSFASFFGTAFGRHDLNEESVVYQQWADNVSVFHEIDAQVPPGFARLTGRDSARIRGAPHSFMTGSARHVSAGPPQVDGPYPCGEGGSYMLVGWNGTMTGTPGRPFTGLFDTGAVSLPEAPDQVSSFLERIRVH